MSKQPAELGQGSRDPFEALDRAGLDELVGEGTFALPGGAQFNHDGAGTPYAIRTWGVIFVEVGVDPDFGLLRLRRAVGVYSACRIVNPVTARAQMTGGIIWGWGKATMEESDQDPVSGRWLAKNLSNVAVPVNADIPGRHRRLVHRGVRRGREPDRGAGHRRARRHWGGRGRRRRGARRGASAGAQPADPALEGPRRGNPR